MKRPLLRRFRLRDARAFTLPEVSIAVAVCMIGLVGLLSLLPAALQGARDAADHTQGARIAQSVIAEIRARPFNTGPGVATAYYDVNGNPGATGPRRYYEVETRRSVRSEFDANGNNVIHVTVRLRWPFLASVKVQQYFTTTVARHE
jgi:uncharacterized protein (TIGR02598 family)